MRIDRLEVENFKGFVRQAIDLHPHFTLLTGGNGSGKTSWLDALAVAAGIWLAEPPASTLSGSRREIARAEIRLEPESKGERVQFREHLPVRVTATGRLGECSPISWTRQIRSGGTRTTNVEAKEALRCVKDLFQRDAAGENVICPVVAYYGAGRAWLPSRHRAEKPHKSGPSRRWAAFYDCFDERIRFPDMQAWFRNEGIERWNRDGNWRPGYAAVRQAILRAAPGATELSYDTDRDQIVLAIDGNAQPFDHLSAGSRMMLALVADLAIKAVTQNAFLLDERESEAGALPAVLARTPGLVLIDELDVHLHPAWQRRVARDLKETFPAIQFVCTSHSPQVIGELTPEEIRVLDGGRAVPPPRSFGIDSSRVLEELMGASRRNEGVRNALKRISRLIDDEQFDEARREIAELGLRIGDDDPEVGRVLTLIAFLEGAEASE